MIKKINKPHIKNEVPDSIWAWMVSMITTMHVCLRRLKA
jgi:hypothetical protein